MLTHVVRLLLGKNNMKLEGDDSIMSCDFYSLLFIIQTLKSMNVQYRRCSLSTLVVYSNDLLLFTKLECYNLYLSACVPHMSRQTNEQKKTNKIKLYKETDTQK